jgi:hypothetical protein
MQRVNAAVDLASARFEAIGKIVWALPDASRTTIRGPFVESTLTLFSGLVNFINADKKSPSCRLQRQRSRQVAN